MQQIPKIIKQINGRAKIVAATKTQSAQRVALLRDYGIKIAGENRVQELMEKHDKVSGIEWHFIGNLQTNKVRHIVDKVSLIHSLDRLSLASEIELQCQKRGLIMNVLIELNLGEHTKGGVSVNQLNSLAQQVLNLPHLRLKGLMCMPPLNSTAKIYESVSQIFAKFNSDFGPMDYLSMGTSHDYLTAIEHGANMVRLGTALFGERA